MVVCKRWFYLFTINWEKNWVSSQSWNQETRMTTLRMLKKARVPWSPLTTIVSHHIPHSRLEKIPFPQTAQCNNVTSSLEMNVNHPLRVTFWPVEGRFLVVEVASSRKICTLLTTNSLFHIQHNKNLQCQILTSHTKPIKFPTYVNNISEKGILKISYYLVQVIYFQAILKES